MIMKIKLFLISVFVVLGVSVKAQSVNGLEVGKKYTITRIEDSLGIATEKNANEDEFRISYELIYQNDIFHFDSNNGFSRFHLETSNFSVCGLFRVGDDIAILSSIPNSYLELKEDDLYYLYLNNSEDPIKISFEDNIITWIGFMMSV